MKSALKIQGRLRLYIDGKQVADHHNLVVNSGVDAIWQAFAGDATYFLTSFQAGTGTSSVTDGDIALDTSTYGAALTSISFPSTGAIKATFDIIPGATTAQNFTEFGLFTVGGVLVARWMDGNTYAYTALNTIQGIWDITITA